jgi:hypothetical protein
MFALLVACVLGQASSDPVLAQRTSFFNALKADLQAKGQVDPAGIQQTREQIGRLTPNELQTLVTLYKSLKQGSGPAGVHAEAAMDRDPPALLPEPLRSELDPQPSLPSLPAVTQASDDGDAGGAGFGAAIYGGLPAASMVPGSYGVLPFSGSSTPFNGGVAPVSGGGAPLPFAGPFGFGTFTATGPVSGYSSPILPGGPPGPMRVGPFGP